MTDSRSSSVDRTGLAIGALSVSGSAVFLKLAATTPALATTARCLLALPVVLVLALRERHSSALSWRAGGAAGVAGVLFAGDMMLWTQAIPEVGAGLSTVLVNAQVAIVPLLAWLIDHERVSTRFLLALPALIAGVVLAGGLFEHGVSGTNPTLGTVHGLGAAVCYSGFLFLLRRGGQGGQPMQRYAVVLATSALLAAIVGAFWPSLPRPASWATLCWLILVAITGQLLGWLLVALCSPRLSSDVSSALLLLTPVGAVGLGALLLGERPSALQFAGCGLVLVAGYLGTAELPGLFNRFRRGQDRCQ